MKTNRWKRYFFYLLIANIIFIGGILSLVFWPISEKELQKNHELSMNNSSEFIVRTTKDNLNVLINAYIDEMMRDKNYHYELLLGDDVHLLGEIPIFSSTVPLSIHLDPYVLEDGNLILKQKSIAIGKLRLPNERIMRYVKYLLTMPEWVTIHPEKEEIHVAITEMNVKSNFEIHVEKFDLPSNHLAFKIKVPYQTLGINQQ